MTKEEIEHIIKRYDHIRRAIQANEEVRYFYIGHRRQKIIITEEVKMVYKIIEDIRISIKDEWLRKMVNGILVGKSDTFLISILPCERNMYYRWKEKFIQTVYRCCVAKQMIEYEELLREGIA